MLNVICNVVLHQITTRTIHVTCLLQLNQIQTNLLQIPRREVYNISSFLTMISDTTLSVLLKICSLGNKCYMVPFKLDRGKKELVLTPTLGHRIFPYFALLYYCVIICFTAFRYTVTSLTDWIFIFLNLTATAIGNLLLGLICRKQVQIVSTINAALKLQTLQCK